MSGDISLELREFVFDRDGWRCRYCGEPCFDIRWQPERFVAAGDDAFAFIDPEDRQAVLDHVIPRCRHGKSTAENLVLACEDCNTRKGAR